MRIALFTETFLPKVDGIVNTLCHLLDHLALRGHTSLLIAPLGGPRHYAETPVVGLPGLPFPIYPELKVVPPPNVNRLLTEFNPDVIHVLNPLSLGLAGLAWGRIKRVPVVASYHTDVPGFAKLWGLGWSVPILWNYFRTLHNLADINLAPSTFTRRELIEQGFRRVKIWGRGVDTGQFNPNHRTLEWRSRLSGGHPQQPLLLYAGRVSPEKRIDWLRPVLDRLPNIRLAIVGDGPQRAELEGQFAGTATVFTGYLHGQDLAQAYAAADLFVFPAPNETLGNTALEALASGLPVVVPNRGGVTDHIRQNYNGLLFQHDDPQALVEAVVSLVEAPAQMAGLGHNAHLYAQGCTWANALDGLLRQYATQIQLKQRLQRFGHLPLNPRPPRNVTMEGRRP